MKSKIFLLLILTGFVIITGCGLLSKKYTKSETEDIRINAAGKTKVKVDNVKGYIKISRSRDTSLITVKAMKEIKVKKKYLNTPFDEIKISLDTMSSIISIKTDIERNRDDNTFNFNLDRGQQVDYEISIPAGISIEIENISGNITAADLDNDLRLDLINGEVNLEKYTGMIDCEITNGSFSGHIDSARGILINTINGGVTLYLNNYMNANVRAETVNGKIIEENLEFREIVKEKNLFRAKLGSGNPLIEIKIETVNGKIRFYGRNEI